MVRRLKQKRSAFGRARDVAIAQERAGWEAYDYVEVMACPSGCINGGGQLKPSPRKVIVAQGDDANAMDVDEPEPATTTTTPASIENITAVKAFVAEMDAAYHSIPTRTPIDNHAAWRIVEHALGGWETPAAEQWLYTSYHDVSAVPSPAEANALTAKW